MQCAGLGPTQLALKIETMRLDEDTSLVQAKPSLVEVRDERDEVELRARQPPITGKDWIRLTCVIPAPTLNDSSGIAPGFSLKI